MSEYVNCQHCINKSCERYGGPYGYTFCDKHISEERDGTDYKEQIECLRKEISELENSELVSELLEIFVDDLLARAEKAERERDAAVRQLASLEICGYCKNGQCTTRGGTKECKFDWNGGQKEE